MRLALLAAAIAIAWPATTRAEQEAAPAAAPPAVVAPAVEQPPGEEAGKPREWRLDLEARLFVRDTVTRVDIGDDAVWRHDRTLDQARVSATYDRAILRLALEVELAGGDAELKDTYIRLTPVDPVRIKAGRFKVPMSFIWNASKWSLPAAERGILAEIEQDARGLPFGGIRGEGVSVEVRPEVMLEPRFTVAVFHNPLATGATPLDPTEDVTQDAYGRLEVEPADWLKAAASFGLVGYTTEVSAIDSYQHLGMGGVELEVDTRYLRAWLEGFVGQSFFYQAGAEASGTFAAARALVAPRLRDPMPGVWRIEPFAMWSVIDPTGDQSGDRISEVAGGVNVAFGKLWRLQLEVAQRIAEGSLALLADSTVIRLQLGARISETIE